MTYTRRDAFTRCHDLMAQDGLLHWTDEAGERGMTSFTAFSTRDVFPSDFPWKRLHEDISYEVELRFTNMQSENIIAGLVALGLLRQDAGSLFDASVRGAIVEFQRTNGLFPSGFVGEATAQAIPGVESFRAE